MQASFQPRTTLLLLASLLTTAAGLSAAPTSAFPQPQPSNREQYLLELINAARANPAAEGRMLANVTDSEILRYYSYYHVNTSQLTSDFNGYAAKPPLAFNANLMASALAQSTYQAASGVQSHNSADGTSFDKRITASGYQWGGCGENVYAYAENPFFGHVGLNADWGVPSLDHRDNIMNLDAHIPTFREIGISCVDSSIKNFGPLVITQDFGTPRDASLAYVTGVIYQDNNGNGTYDEGEGLGGVTVTPDTGDYYAVTTASGGFAIPLPKSGQGTLTVTAAGAGLGASRVKTVAYAAGTNVKLDFTPNDAGQALPVVTMSVPSKDAVPSAQQGQVLITRSGDLSQPLQINLSYGGKAKLGVDCHDLPGTLTIPAGQDSVQMPVVPTDGSRPAVVKLKVKVQAESAYQVNAPGGKAATGKVRIWPVQ